MEIKIFGTGCCSSCSTLFNDVEEVVKELGVDATVEKINDMMQMVQAGIMSTPAVMIDGKIIHAGSEPEKDVIKSWFK